MTGAAKPVHKLAGDVARDSALLAKQELQLAKAKSQDALTTVGIGLIYIVVGASLLTGAIIALLAAAVAGLTPQLPLWQACSAVGIAALIVAALFIKLAQTRLKNVNSGETAPEIKPGVENVVPENFGIKNP